MKHEASGYQRGLSNEAMLHVRVRDPQTWFSRWLWLHEGRESVAIDGKNPEKATDWQFAMDDWVVFADLVTVVGASADRCVYKAELVHRILCSQYLGSREALSDS